MPNETMKAACFEGAGGPEVIKITEVKRPKPAQGELLIKVTAAGVNRPDVMQRKGQYPPPPGASPLPGLEVSGTVVGAGDGVSMDWIDQPVVALLTGGGYAQYAAAPVEQVLPAPAGLALVDAAGIPETFFTVWSNLFQRAYAKEGETLLVHGGTSGIGTTAIQLAKAFGLTVITTAGSDEKTRACIQLGADLAINYKTESFEEAVKTFTNGRGVDIVLDMIGGDYLPRNIKCMAENARHVTIAFQNGPKTDISLAPIMLKRLTLTGSTLRARPPSFKGAIAAELREYVWPSFENGSIKPLIYKTFPLEEAAAAHALMDSSAHIGKILLTMNPG